MWGSSEEPPGVIEGEASVVHARDKCEQNKSQLESLKEIMLKNKQSLMKKEEEAQEYARRLSSIKSRAKLSRRSKEGSSGSKEATHITEIPGASEELNIDDVSQAKTPKARSTLLQKKLAENRKAFEQRNKEISETKRAVEEKVEAIRQQLEEKDVAAIGFQREQPTVLPIKPVVITSDIMTPVQIESLQEKDNKIAELTNRMLELEATIVDLQENLKEKDSVIDSKTKAVTLMSADLSRKGKTTLDTLEDTKDEMRTMQEHFVLLEESLKSKNENLLMQLQERDKKIEELEESVDRFEKQIDQQKLSESASADFSRSTMDALVETKEAMRSMQENFVLIESSLKTKNENLLQQLNEYELKLAEANERVFQLESGIGIVKDPTVDDLRYKLEKFESSNKQLQDEKYELQKSVAELQDKIVNLSSMHGNGAIIEKDNRILELENLIEELKQSNKLLEEESKAELQKQVAELTSRNEEYLNRVTDLESLVHRLEEERNELAAKLPEGVKGEDEKITRLTKELEDLNKSMIKIKAQHKSKVKGLQKQLENFKKVSDTNAELVRLGNQVALLEEEKGNLQLSLVDFDELKASAGDWQERVIDLESKVSAQTKEIEMQIDAIATLENQKLDLMQELHTAKQEISSLEAENAESENLRVTAEMKVVDLEEQLEALHKSQTRTDASSHSELLKQIKALTQENAELYHRISKLEEKGTSDSGSTESFEAIQELDKTDLLKRLEDLTHRNNELTLKLNKYEETGSTESVNDSSRNELLKRIDQLTQENADLTMKLSRIEEKGSDTGSTESFERIPEHNEAELKNLMEKNNKLKEEIELLSSGKVDLKHLMEENNKLKEEIELLSSEKRDETKAERLSAISKEELDLKVLLTNLLEENNKLKEEIELLSSNNAEKIEASDVSKEDTDLKIQLANLIEENNKLKEEIELLSSVKAEKTEADGRTSEISESSKEGIDLNIQLIHLTEENNKLKEQIEILSSDKVELRNLIEENNKLKEEIELLTEKIEATTRISDISESSEEIDLKIELLKLRTEVTNLIEENTKLKQEIDLLSDATKTQTSEDSKEETDFQLQLSNLMEEKNVLQKELKELRNSLEQREDIQIDELKIKLEELSQAKEELLTKLTEFETLNKKLADDLLEATQEKEELSLKLDQLLFDAKMKEELKSSEKMEVTEKLEVHEGEPREKRELEESNLIEELKIKLSSKEEEIEESTKMMETLVKKMELLESELKETSNTITEWKSKHDSMESKLEKLETEKSSLEEKLQSLQDENEILKNNEEANSLKQKLQDLTKNFESRLMEKENEISDLKEEIEERDRELQNKFDELRNKMIAIDTLQDEINDYKIIIEEKESSLATMTNQISELNSLAKNKEEEIHSLRSDVIELSNKIEDSKPLEDYNDLLEKFKRKDVLINEMEHKINVTTSENFDLIEKVKNMTQRNDEIESELADKKEEIRSLLKMKDNLEAEIFDYKNNKAEVENRVLALQAAMEKNEKFIDDLQMELKESYRRLELMEDVRAQNEKLESLKEELNSKTKECEVLRGELEEKEGLISKNFTEEVRLELEGKIGDLEGKLKAAEDKIQAQLERMKKLTANLKKRTAICQELESRVAELEEKWTSEKDEKEAKNKQIQEVEILIHEKDNRITDLEEKLTKSRSESTVISKTIDHLSNDLTNSKEKISLLTQQITEMEEEITKLRTNLDTTTAALKFEEETKNNIMAGFETYKQEVAEENAKKQSELEEVTEKARELSVRMQVMETEYLQQLTLINNLKAENGLLLSKQAQINEKLETVEKESEERRLLLEKSKTSDEEVKNHCEQCQMLVQALEAKLQEREAEIENLDNELANSIGNFVQMRESLRFNDLMNQGRNRSLEDNDLLFQYNSLASSYEEVKGKLEGALKENKELITRIEELEFANSTLEEKVAGLEESSENTERMQNVSGLNQEVKMAEEGLGGSSKNVEEETGLEVKGLEESSEKTERLSSASGLISQETLNSLKLVEPQSEYVGRGLEEEIEALRSSKLACERRIEDLSMELEVYKNQSSKLESREEISDRQLSSVEGQQLSLGRFAGLQEEDVEKLLEDKRRLEEEISSLNGSKLACERRIEDLSVELEVYKNQSSKLEIEDMQLIPVKYAEPQKEDMEKLLEDRRRLEEEISSLKSTNLACERRIEDLLMELELHKNESSKREKKEAPQLFDASRIFGLPSSSDLLTDNEVKRLQSMLEEKEAQCSNLTQELNHLQKLMLEERAQMSLNYSRCVEELQVARADLEGLERAMAEKNSQIDWLNAELSNLSVELKNDTRMDNRVEELNTSLNEARKSLEEVSAERDRQIEIVEDYKLEVERLEGELRNVTADSEATIELEKRVSSLTRERDLLQLQVNDLSRSLEEHKTSTKSQIQRLTHERDMAREHVSNLTQTLEQTTSKDMPSQESPSAQQPTESPVLPEEPPKEESASGWDAGPSSQLAIDEEWGWNAEDVLPASSAHLDLHPSTEIHLRATIDDLQEQIKDLEKERERMIEESKSAQLRNAKMIKKLKEYKVQVENLQQQLKIQKSSDFYQLDSAIEEELKSQISKLEKALAEAKEEKKSTLSEKEALAKRLDVVVAANERYMEMKERQDMEMEVLRIRGKELTDKVETLEKRLSERTGNGDSKVSEGFTESSDVGDSSLQRAKRSIKEGEEEDYAGLCKKYKEEIDDLREEMEALASENEQLQRFLEEQKMKLKENNEEVVDKRVSELQNLLSKSREEYDLLRKQYEQSLMDANDQVMIMRQNADLLKEETGEKTRKLEEEINNLRQQLEVGELNILWSQKNLEELNERMSTVIDEKKKLEEEIITLRQQLEISELNLLEFKKNLEDLKEEKASTVSDEKKKLEGEINNLRQQLNITELNLVESQKSLEDLKEDKRNLEESLRTSTDSYEKQLSSLNASMAEITDLLNARIQEAADLKQKQYVMSVEHEEVQVKLQEVIEELSRELNEKKQQIETLKGGELKEELNLRESELARYKEEINKLSEDNERYLKSIEELQERLINAEEKSVDFDQTLSEEVKSLEVEIARLRSILMEKESILQRYSQESGQYKIILNNNEAEVQRLEAELLKKSEEINTLNFELEETRKILEEARIEHPEQSETSSNIVDGLPLFRMADDSQGLQQTIDVMQAELEKRQEEIEHLKYILNENTYPSMIQKMQETINCLYNEKSELESSLATANLRNEEKEEQISSLRYQMEEGRNVLSKEGEIVRLQNDLHAKEQEINELKYIISEKESLLSSMEPDDFGKEEEIRQLKSALASANLRNEEKEEEMKQMKHRIEEISSEERGTSIQVLQNELYRKEEEIQQLRSALASANLRNEEMEKEIKQMKNQLEEIASKEEGAISMEVLRSELQGKEEEIQKLQMFSEETKNQLEKVEEFFQKKLEEKESEIDEIKRRLAEENRGILEQLQLRDRDIENLKRQQAEFTGMELHQRREELNRVQSELIEKERSLNEWSVTKEAEIRNLRVQIEERDIRIQELSRLSTEEERQITELRSTLEARETEINSLKSLLEEKANEYRLIQNVLKKESAEVSSEGPSDAGKSNSQELDLALYMLHQRDVRCEELTHELMSLLEERDTLQLRLSNAIRVNEELRKASAGSDSPKKESSDTAGPVVEQASPTRSEGPVEIAKEAIDDPIGEDKERLALKLSQLHTVSHAKDVRLKDERELRHTQQMSLLAHKDVLSTLPPEAAARLVNANYTLSRDVQSQSSVLLNWLWGKSTPKVIHM